MKTGRLIIFSGLPGSGKSTLAKRLASHLHATNLRIDTIEQGLREVCGISQIDGKGYRLAYRIAEENLRLGITVIADSVNPWALTRREWNSVAETVGVPFLNLEIICSDKQEHKRRVENRIDLTPDLKTSTWKQVLERDYHVWDKERKVLDTSGRSEDACFADLLSIVQ